MELTKKPKEQSHVSKDFNALQETVIVVTIIGSHYTIICHKAKGQSQKHTGCREAQKAISINRPKNVFIVIQFYESKIDQNIGKVECDILHNFNKSY